MPLDGAAWNRAAACLESPQSVWYMAFPQASFGEDLLRPPVKPLTPSYGPRQLLNSSWPRNTVEHWKAFCLSPWTMSSDDLEGHRVVGTFTCWNIYLCAKCLKSTAHPVFTIFPYVRIITSIFSIFPFFLSIFFFHLRKPSLQEFHVPWGGCIQKLILSIEILCIK